MEEKIVILPGNEKNVTLPEDSYFVFTFEDGVDGEYDKRMFFSKVEKDVYRIKNDGTLALTVSFIKR